MKTTPKIKTTPNEDDPKKEEVIKKEAENFLCGISYPFKGYHIQPSYILGCLIFFLHHNIYSWKGSLAISSNPKLPIPPKYNNPPTTQYH